MADVQRVWEGQVVEIWKLVNRSIGRPKTKRNVAGVKPGKALAGLRFELAGFELSLTISNSSPFLKEL